MAFWMECTCICMLIWMIPTVPWMNWYRMGWDGGMVPNFCFKFTRHWCAGCPQQTWSRISATKTCSVCWLAWSNSVNEISVYIKFSSLIGWKSCLALGSLFIVFISFIFLLQIKISTQTSSGRTAGPEDSSWNTLYLRLLAEPVHLSANSRVLCRCTADLHLGKTILVHLELLYICISMIFISFVFLSPEFHLLPWHFSISHRRQRPARYTLALLVGEAIFTMRFFCINITCICSTDSINTSTTTMVSYGFIRCGKHLWQEGAEVELCSDFEWSGG